MPDGMLCPLIPGSSRPLLRPGKICAEIHGDSGLDSHVSLDFPDIPKYAMDYIERLSRLENETHFTTLMYKYLKSSEKPVTFIATGPLTNLALLFINYPDSYKYIEKIVLMGGAMGVGNTGNSES